MGARVRLALQGPSGRRLVAAALLNGGFESPGEPCVLLPVRAAVRLLPTYPAGTVAEPVDLAAGHAVTRAATDLLAARVVAAGRRGPPTRVRVLVSEDAAEILVSDTGIDALGVEVVRPGQGLWRFAGERKLRRSVRPRCW